MTPRARKWLIWLGYFLFYIFSFIAFFYLTFPFNKLRDRVVSSFNASQHDSQSPMQLEIDELSSYWLSGVEADGVRLVSPASVTPNGEKKPASVTKIDHATARVALLPLLIGHVTINYSLNAFGGVVDGSFTKNGDDRNLSTQLEDVQVGKLQPVVDMVGLPLQGTLNGSLSWAMPEGKLSKTKGSVELTIASLAIGDGKAKIHNTIALPKMVVGTMALKAKISNGHMVISKLGAKGRDLSLSSNGKIDFYDTLSQSKVDLFIKFKFSDKYKTKNDKTKAIFGAPGSKVPALFEMADPKIKRSKRSDGFYSWRIWGLMNTLRYDPAPMGASRASPRSKGGRTKKSWGMPHHR